MGIFDWLFGGKKTTPPEMKETIIKKPDAKKPSVKTVKKETPAADISIEKGEGEGNGGSDDLRQGERKQYYNSDGLRKKTTRTKKEKEIIIEKIKVTIYGGDNMCGYNNCNVDILILKEDLDWYLEELGIDFDDFDGELWVGSPGIVVEIIESHSKEECVLVDRYQIFDNEKMIYYETVELQTILPNKSEDGVNDDLNKVYYKKGRVTARLENESNEQYTARNRDNPIEYNIMNEKEIKEFNDEWDYCVDNRYYGFDIYTLKNFDLELELKTGYL